MFKTADIIRKLFNRRKAKPAEVPQQENRATVDFVYSIAKKYGLVSDSSALPNGHCVYFVIEGNLRLPDGHNIVAKLCQSIDHRIAIMFSNIVRVNPHGMVLVYEQQPCDSYVLEDITQEFVENGFKTLLQQIDEALVTAEKVSISSAKQDLERMFEQCSQN